MLDALSVRGANLSRPLSGVCPTGIPSTLKCEEVLDLLVEPHLQTTDTSRPQPADLSQALLTSDARTAGATSSVKRRICDAWSSEAKRRMSLVVPESR